MKMPEVIKNKSSQAGPQPVAVFRRKNCRQLNRWASFPGRHRASARACQEPGQQPTSEQMTMNVCATRVNSNVPMINASRLNRCAPGIEKPAASPAARRKEQTHRAPPPR
jgi:hypothetical protein